MRILKQSIRLFFLLSVLLTATKANAQPLTKADRVSVNGIGSLRIGMTLQEASKAIHTSFKREEYFNEDCGYVTPTQGPKGLAFMVTEGRIWRIDVDEPTLATMEGAKVGDSEAKIKQLYPGQVKVEGHDYLEGGHNLIVRPAQRKDDMIIFETDGKTVTSYRAGRAEEVSYSEGCS